MFKRVTCWAVVVYATALIILGTLGYSLHGSRISVVMGASFGALLLICAAAMFKRKAVAAYLATGCTLALTVIFSIRYSATNKPIPALLAVLSGAMLLFLLAQIAKWKKG